MNTKKAFGKALRKMRKEKELTQEDFSDISSRTYLSTLERGIKSPTLEKIEALCERMQVHPLVLLAATYKEKGDVEILGILAAMKNSKKN